MTVSEYIKLFANCSETSQHELITKCLEYYALQGTQELSLEQVVSWWEFLQSK